MNYTTRLLIPVGLAIAAAVANYLSMTAGTRPTAFVQATRDLKSGESFADSNLGKLDLPAAFHDLRATAIPYEHVGVLYGQPAPRDFRKGDIIFWRDSPESGPQIHLGPDEDVVPISLEHVEVVPALLRIGSEVSFRFKRLDDQAEPDWIGPFRIVSIGNRLSEEKESASAYGTSKTISVAVKNKDNRAREAKDAQFEECCDLITLDKAKLLRIKHHPSRVLQPSSAAGR
jgi:hypothetical protein